MALVLADRVKETTTTTGAGTVTLLGASSGFQSFAVVGNANTTYYTIAGQTGNEWEVGIGTYTASGTTLGRTTVLANSSGTQPSALSFSAGTKDVFVTYPAGKSVNLDASGNATALGTPVAFVGTNITGLPISTGVSGLGTGVATFLGTPSSANLRTALTDETGTGVAVFGTSPAITTSLTTASTTFALLNTTATTLNIGGAATTINIGAATGTMTVANATLAAKAITASTTLGVTGVSTLTGGAVIEGLTVGLGAGAVNSNTAVGVTALNANTTGSQNTSVGQVTLANNLGGTSNTAVGNTVLTQNISGNQNTAVGVLASRSNTTGSDNVAIGVNALYSNTTFSGNTAVGSGALYSANGGSNSTVIGYSAGTTAYGGTNTFLGYSSGSAVTSGANNVILGSYTGSAAPISATGSNYIVLSDGAGTVRQVIDSSGNVGIGTTAPSAKLDVAGNAIISTTDNTNAALRITQLGTGNSLLVEDSTNPDSTPVVITNAGKTGFGTLAPAATVHVSGDTILSNVNVIGASYDSVSFSVAAEETSPTDLFFSPDGLKMYVIGSAGDDVNEYNLSTAWVVSSAVFATNFSVSGQDTAPAGLFFRADGTKMYVVGQTNDTVFQYTLSTPWSVTTASYDSISFSVATQEVSPSALFFKPNGLSMYVVGATGDAVYQYTLSTAWNVSTATFLQSFSISGQEALSQGLTFTSDGSRMFITGSTGDDVNVYNLTTPWDISTSAFVNVFSVSGQDTSPQGIYIKPDGTKMYIVGSGNDTIFQYTVPSIDIQLTGQTSVAALDVQQDLIVYGNTQAYKISASSGARIEGLTVGKGAGAVADNTAVGVSALLSNTVGSENTGVGYGALTDNITGNGNTGVGYLALSSTTGSSNTAVGSGTLNNNNTGANNIAIGRGTLTSNTTGDSNVVVGNTGLALSTIASFNTAVGHYALNGSTSGSTNVAFGYLAGSLITTGSNNVVIGGYTGSAAPISATGSNWIVLSDGAANVRQAIDSAGNSQFLTGAVVVYAPAPATTISAATTLTNAQLQPGIVVTSGTSFTLTMALGTTLETLVTWAATNLGFDFSIINTASGTITLDATEVGVTSVGTMTVLTGISAQFRIRRTAANTFIVYRIG